jgi:hypothetical protein
MKKSLKSVLFAIILGLGAFATQAQNTSFRTAPVTAKFVTNTPATITILSPEGLNEVTRGFKQRVSNQILLVGTITDDDDGIRLVLINNQEVKLAESGLFNITLDLKPGANEIVFYVLDNEDKSTKKIYEVETPAKTNEMITESGNYYALLIGIDQYEDPEISDLDKPIADAKELGRVLEENYTFAKENIQYLNNPTRSEIVEAFDALSHKLGKEDNLLIFYAGHGYWDVEKKTGYWIPSNGKKSSTAEWFRNTTLTDQMRAMDTKHTLLIADACFSGSIFKSRSVNIAEAEVAVKKLYDMPSRKAMTSGTLTEVPDESQFMKYLTKKLTENTEKYTPSSELFNAFRRAVINNSSIVPQYGTIQNAGDEGGDFIFIRRD